MKSFIQVLVSLFLILSVLSCNRQPSFQIDGKVKGATGYIYLQSFRNKMFFIIDSSKIENGNFHFKGSVERPDLFGLTTDREETFEPGFIFVENSKIQVEIDAEDYKSIEVTGSSAHDLYKSYLLNRRDFNIDSFIVVHPASTVAAYILYRNFSPRFSAEELARNVKRFDPSLNDLPYIIELKEIISTKEKVAIGRQAVDFPGTGLDGEKIHLKDFTGKYVLLEFWASWCAPCRKENPHLVKVYNKYNEKGFEILAVSLDSKKENWLKAIETDQLPWVHVSDLKYWDSEPAKIYGIRQIPSNVLIGPSGNIIDKNLKGEKLDTVMEELFAGK